MFEYDSINFKLFSDLTKFQNPNFEITSSVVLDMRQYEFRI